MNKTSHLDAHVLTSDRPRRGNEISRRRRGYSVVGVFTLIAGLTSMNAVDAQVRTDCGFAPAGMNVIEDDSPIIYGTDGPDFICAGTSANTIYGYGGDDIINAKGGDDSIFGGSGDDLIRGRYGNDTITGGDGNDRIFGQKGADTINGGAGNDVINGGGGPDVVAGGDGADTITGSYGNDVLRGNLGNDTLSGQWGADTLVGGYGDDILRGGFGNDTLDGGAGTNTVDGGAGTNTIIGEQDADLTTAGIVAAQWSSNVEITMGDGSFQFVSDGLPSHELPDQFLIPTTNNQPPFGDDDESDFEIVNTDELIVASPLDVEITLNPVLADEPTATALGQIGVMISGASLFNDYEDMALSTVALDDNRSINGVYFIDACNGHPLASGMQYHYHGVPYCITDAVDVAGQHSTIIGVLLDGFPIYGPADTDGVMVSNADLDECSGHFGPTPEFPNGIYHYHLTEDANPYSIDCFHGEIDYDSTSAMPGGELPGGPGGERPTGPPLQG